jgi:hypothetical protein
VEDYFRRGEPLKSPRIYNREASNVMYCIWGSTTVYSYRIHRKLFVAMGEELKSSKILRKLVVAMGKD